MRCLQIKTCKHSQSIIMSDLWSLPGQHPRAQSLSRVASGVSLCHSAALIAISLCHKYFASHVTSP